MERLIIEAMLRHDSNVYIGPGAAVLSNGRNCRFFSIILHAFEMLIRYTCRILPEARSDMSLFYNPQPLHLTFTSYRYGMRTMQLSRHGIIADVDKQ